MACKIPWLLTSGCGGARFHMQLQGRAPSSCPPVMTYRRGAEVPAGSVRHNSILMESMLFILYFYCLLRQTLFLRLKPLPRMPTYESARLRPSYSFPSGFLLMHPGGSRSRFKCLDLHSPHGRPRWCSWLLVSASLRSGCCGLLI